MPITHPSDRAGVGWGGGGLTQKRRDKDAWFLFLLPELEANGSHVVFVVARFAVTAHLALAAVVV